jgi:hypothetical protein
MNIEYILMMSFYTLRSIVAFKSENSIKMPLSRKIGCDDSASQNNSDIKTIQQIPVQICHKKARHQEIVT